MKGLIYFLLPFLALSGSVFAAGGNYFEVIGAVGAARLDAENSTLGVTSSETDKLVQTNSNNWDTFGAQLGAGYVYYFSYAQRFADHVQWFPSIEPELNVYYLGNNSIKGNVLRFNSSSFNELTYNASFNSTRLMVDAALTIASYKMFSVYAIGGIGNAWNRTGYSDTDNGGTPCPNQRLRLNSNTNSNFAWEAGAGVQYAINDRVGVSLEYLYADLGKAKSAATGNTGTITAPIIIPANFNLSAQTALFGVHISL